MFRLALACLIFCAAHTQASAGVTATQYVEKEVAARTDDGENIVKRIKAEAVTPGEEVIYSLRFSNDAANNADAVVLVMPVPTEVSYVEGSVAGKGAGVTFSIDGGQTYVARGRLMVAEEGIERPAKSNEITHIKWTLTDPLPTQAKGEVSFRAVLK